MLPNKHNWSELFIGDICRLCHDYRTIPRGTGKTQHALAHVREGKAKRVGEGTNKNPYRYVAVSGWNTALSHSGDKP